VISLKAVACSSTRSGSEGIEAYLSSQLASYSALTLFVGLSDLSKLPRNDL